MAELVVFGAGKLARLVTRYFHADGGHRVVAYALDAAYRKAQTYEGLPLVDFEDLPARYPPERYQVFVAAGYAGMNALRARKCAEALALGYTLASYVSPRATILTDAPVGGNALLLEGVTVQPFAAIGQGVLAWTGTTICHDSVVGDHCFFGAGVVVSGFVEIGERCFFGANAAIGDKVRIAPRTLVGAGAVITHDTEPDGVYVPARAVKLDCPSSDINL